MNNINNTPESLSQNDIIQLRDCIAFAIDNNDELGANDIIELDQINRALLLILESNKLWLIQTITPRIEVARL